MQTQHNTWNNASDLKELALGVMAEQAWAMNARTAAQVLSGVMGIIVVRFDLSTMQRTCAELVRHSPSWATNLGRLPSGADGRVADAMQLVATVARGVLPLCGKAALRQALSYWATESDPASWACLAPHK